MVLPLSGPVRMDVAGASPSPGPLPSPFAAEQPKPKRRAVPTVAPSGGLIPAARPVSRPAPPSQAPKRDYSEPEGSVDYIADLALRTNRISREDADWLFKQTKDIETYGEDTDDQIQNKQKAIARVVSSIGGAAKDGVLDKRIASGLIRSLRQRQQQLSGKRVAKTLSPLERFGIGAQSAVESVAKESTAPTITAGVLAPGSERAIEQVVPPEVLETGAAQIGATMGGLFPALAEGVVAGGAGALGARAAGLPVAAGVALGTLGQQAIAQTLRRNVQLSRRDAAKQTVEQLVQQVEQLTSANKPVPPQLQRTLAEANSELVVLEQGVTPLADAARQTLINAAVAGLPTAVVQRYVAPLLAQTSMTPAAAARLGQMIEGGVLNPASMVAQIRVLEGRDPTVEELAFAGALSVGGGAVSARAAGQAADKVVNDLARAYKVRDTKAIKSIIADLEKSGASREERRAVAKEARSRAQGAKPRPVPPQAPPAAAAPPPKAAGAWTGDEILAPDFAGDVKKGDTLTLPTDPNDPTKTENFRVVRPSNAAIIVEAEDGSGTFRVQTKGTNATGYEMWANKVPEAARASAQAGVPFGSYKAGRQTAAPGQVVKLQLSPNNFQNFFIDAVNNDGTWDIRADDGTVLVFNPSKAGLDDAKKFTTPKAAPAAAAPAPATTAAATPTTPATPATAGAPSNSDKAKLLVGKYMRTVNSAGQEFVVFIESYDANTGRFKYRLGDKRKSTGSKFWDDQQLVEEYDPARQELDALKAATSIDDKEKAVAAARAKLDQLEQEASAAERGGYSKGALQQSRAELDAAVAAEPELQVRAQQAEEQSKLQRIVDSLQKPDVEFVKDYNPTLMASATPEQQAQAKTKYTAGIQALAREFLDLVNNPILAAQPTDAQRVAALNQLQEDFRKKYGMVGDKKTVPAWVADFNEQVKASVPAGGGISAKSAEAKTPPPKKEATAPKKEATAPKKEPAARPEVTFPAPANEMEADAQAFLRAARAGDKKAAADVEQKYANKTATEMAEWAATKRRVAQSATTTPVVEPTAAAAAETPVTETVAAPAAAEPSVVETAAAETPVSEDLPTDAVLAQMRAATTVDELDNILDAAGKRSKEDTAKLSSAYDEMLGKFEEPAAPPPDAGRPEGELVKIGNKEYIVAERGVDEWKIYTKNTKGNWKKEPDIYSVRDKDGNTLAKQILKAENEAAYKKFVADTGSSSDDIAQVVEGFDLNEADLARRLKSDPQFKKNWEKLSPPLQEDQNLFDYISALIEEAPKPKKGAQPDIPPELLDEARAFLAADDAGKAALLSESEDPTALREAAEALESGAVQPDKPETAAAEAAAPVALSNGFSYEIIERGPQQWKVRVFKDGKNVGTKTVATSSTIVMELRAKLDQAAAVDPNIYAVENASGAKRYYQVIAEEEGRFLVQETDENGVAAKDDKGKTKPLTSVGSATRGGIVQSILVARKKAAEGPPTAAAETPPAKAEAPAAEAVPVDVEKLREIALRAFKAVRDAREEIQGIKNEPGRRRDHAARVDEIMKPFWDEWEDISRGTVGEQGTPERLLADALLDLRVAAIANPQTLSSDADLLRAYPAVEPLLRAPEEAKAPAPETPAPPRKTFSEAIKEKSDEELGRLWAGRQRDLRANPANKDHAKAVKQLEAEAAARGEYRFAAVETARIKRLREIEAERGPVGGAKPAAPKTEAPKTEALKAEPKTEAPKTEPTKTETTAPKTETTKTEAPKTEAPKTEPKTEAEFLSQVREAVMSSKGGLTPEQDAKFAAMFKNPTWEPSDGALRRFVLAAMPVRRLLEEGVARIRNRRIAELTGASDMSEGVWKGIKDQMIYDEFAARGKSFITKVNKQLETFDLPKVPTTGVVAGLATLAAAAPAQAATIDGFVNSAITFLPDLGRVVAHPDAAFAGLGAAAVAAGLLTGAVRGKLPTFGSWFNTFKNTPEVKAYLDAIKRDVARRDAFLKQTKSTWNAVFSALGLAGGATLNAGRAVERLGLRKLGEALADRRNLTGAARDDFMTYFDGGLRKAAREGTIRKVRPAFSTALRNLNDLAVSGSGDSTLAGRVWREGLSSTGLDRYLVEGQLKDVLDEQRNLRKVRTDFIRMFGEYLTDKYPRPVDRERLFRFLSLRESELTPKQRREYADMLTDENVRGIREFLETATDDVAERMGLSQGAREEFRGRYLRAFGTSAKSVPERVFQTLSKFENLVRPGAFAGRQVEKYRGLAESDDFYDDAGGPNAKTGRQKRDEFVEMRNREWEVVNTYDQKVGQTAVPMLTLEDIDGNRVDIEADEIGNWNVEGLNRKWRGIVDARTGTLKAIRDFTPDERQAQGFLLDGPAALRDTLYAVSKSGERFNIATAIAESGEHAVSGRTSDDLQQPWKLRRFGRNDALGVFEITDDVVYGNNGQPVGLKVKPRDGRPDATVPFARNQQTGEVAVQNGEPMLVGEFRRSESTQDFDRASNFSPSVMFGGRQWEVLDVKTPRKGSPVYKLRRGNDIQDNVPATAVRRMRLLAVPKGVREAATGIGAFKPGEFNYGDLNDMYVSPETYTLMRSLTEGSLLQKAVAAFDRSYLGNRLLKTFMIAQNPRSLLKQTGQNLINLQQVGVSALEFPDYVSRFNSERELVSGLQRLGLFEGMGVTEMMGYTGRRGTEFNPYGTLDMFKDNFARFEKSDKSFADYLDFLKNGMVKAGAKGALRVLPSLIQAQDAFTRFAMQQHFEAQLLAENPGMGLQQARKQAVELAKENTYQSSRNAFLTLLDRTFVPFANAWAYNTYVQPVIAATNPAGYLAQKLTTGIIGAIFAEDEDDEIEVATRKGIVKTTRREGREAMQDMLRGKELEITSTGIPRTTQIGEYILRTGGFDPSRGRLLPDTGGRLPATLEIPRALSRLLVASVLGDRKSKEELRDSLSVVAGAREGQWQPPVTGQTPALEIVSDSIKQLLRTYSPPTEAGRKIVQPDATVADSRLLATMRLLVDVSKADPKKLLRSADYYLTQQERDIIAGATERKRRTSDKTKHKGIDAEARARIAAERERVRNIVSVFNAATKKP